MKVNRNFWLVLFLSIITCGIYQIIFMYEMTEDINKACQDNDKSPNYIVVIILSLITCSIYYFYWMYKQGNRMCEAGQRYGIYMKDNGSTILLWYLFGSFLCGIGPYVSLYKMINNINILSEQYNRQRC